jgi:hypothetical protein
LKREVVEGEKAFEAQKRIARATNRALKIKTGKEPVEQTPSPSIPSQPVLAAVTPPIATSVQPHVGT